MASSGSYAGAPLARGPMGGEHYTQIHNGFFRDTRLSAKAKGIFGWLSTHKDAYEVSVFTIAQAMTDGVESIRTGLKELEQFSYLIRDRQRGYRGKMSTSVWFFTDLPAQIIQLGITDEAIITEKVQERFQEWLNGRSEPQPENRIVVATSGNRNDQPSEKVEENPKIGSWQPPAEIEHLPTSEPRSDFPHVVEPHVANRTIKKTKEKKTSIKNNNQKKKESIDARAHTREGEAGPLEIEGEKEGEKTFSSSTQKKPQASQECSDVALAAIVSLQWERYRWTISTRQARELGLLIDEAVEDGHTVSALKRHLNNRLQTCHTNPFYYLSTALTGDELPPLAPREPEPEPFSVVTGPQLVPVTPDYGSTKVDLGGRALPKEHVQASDPEFRRKLLEDFRRKNAEKKRVLPTRNPRKPVRRASEPVGISSALQEIGLNGS